MLGIGIFGYVNGKKNDMEVYILGGRNFGPVLTAFGTGTTLASAAVFLGYVGLGYNVGLVSFAQVITACLFEFFGWRLIARKLRNYSIHTGSMTAVEAMSKFKGDPHNLIKIIGGFLVGTFVLFYLSGQINGGAKAVTAMNIDFKTAGIICTVLVIVYTMLGGVRSVMWTDAIQGIMMIVSLILLLGYCLIEVGGFGNMFAKMLSVDPALIHWNRGMLVVPAILYIINSWAGNTVGFLAQPQAIQKYMTMNSNKNIPQAAIYSILFNFIRQAVPVVIGMCGRVIMPGLKDPELLIPLLISTIFPGIVGGIVLASLFAAIMSTADSLLLQASGEFSRNVLQQGLLKGKNVSQRTIAWLCRIFVVCLGIAAVLVALNSTSSVYSLSVFGWSGLASSCVAAIYLGFFWKKTTSWGIFSAIVTGIPVTMVWRYVFKPSTDIHEQWPGLLVPFVACIVVSLLTQKCKAGSDMVPVSVSEDDV
jgi:SSS family transporter